MEQQADFQSFYIKLVSHHQWSGANVETCLEYLILIYDLNFTNQKTTQRYEGVVDFCPNVLYSLLSDSEVWEACHPNVNAGK